MDLETHISLIIGEFRFDVRSKTYPSACICYEQQKQCHDMPDLNCFLCYCPYYRITSTEGGCLRGSNDGKWYYSDKLPLGKIWDCSGCTYPHTENAVKEHLTRAFKPKWGK